MIWNFHVFLPLSDVLACIPITSDVLKCIPITSDVLTLYNCHSLVSWNVLLQFAQVLECIATTSRSLSLCVFQWIATFWHFGRYNYYVLTFFGECISTTFSSLGMHYHHSLMFWDILLPLSDVLECISILSLSCVFGIYFYQFWCFGIYNTLPCFMTYWYYFLAFWNAFLPLHDHYHGFRMNCPLSFWDVHLSLTTFWNLLLNVLLPLSKVLEFITIGAFWCFGMYYNFLTFWNVLLQLSDVLECITTF